MAGGDGDREEHNKNVKTVMIWGSKQFSILAAVLQTQQYTKGVQPSSPHNQQIRRSTATLAMASPQASTILAERILPARGAAKRASASFSEQLMSSPTRSEGKHSESDSPGSSNPFGGPNSHGTKTIKYRYSATGKHRSSPLKGSSSSPERKIINTSKPRVKPKAKPLPAFTPSAST
ncbi:hypothetical protein BS17DRAFT_770921, partial [Gyrodon lividus]